MPVVSVMRLAARPVGAARTILLVASENISNIAFVIVVFPVPGPPVMTVILLVMADFTASICFSASLSCSLPCAYWMHESA